MLPVIQYQASCGLYRNYKLSIKFFPLYRTMRASHKSRAGETNNKMFFFMAFFPKNINRRLKTLPFRQLSTRVSAALKNYARKEPLLARYILKPVQLVHRTKIDQSKKNHILICQDPRCIKKNSFLHIHIALSLECNKCFSKVSWVDCEDKQFTCPTDKADRCVTSYSQKW